MNQHDDICTKGFEVPDWLNEMPVVSMKDVYDEKDEDNTFLTSSESDASNSEISADCPLSEKYAENEFKMDIKAKYPTRSDKFLTSVLMNGPNNQLIGLRETMFIAIKLNRSYILVS